MLLNQFDIEKYIKIAADRADLRVVWEDFCMPRTDGKTVFLPQITMNTTEEEAKNLMWYVTHEASHNVHTNFDFVKEKAVNASKSELAALFNQLEDDNIDYLNGSVFKGDKELCVEHVSRVLPSLLAKAQERKKAGKDKEMGEKWDHLMAMLAFEADFRDDYCPGVGQYSDEFKKLINNKEDTKVDKLLSGPYKEELRKLRKDTTTGRSKKVWELARKIFEEVMNGDADKEEQRLKEQAASGKGDKEGAGSGGSNGDGEGGEQGKAKGKGRAKSGGKDGDELNEEFIEVDYDEWATDPSKFVRHQKVGGGQRLHYGKDVFDRSEDYLPTPLQETHIIDYEKNRSNYHYIKPLDENNDVSGHYADKYRKKAFNTSDGFANKVRMLLQIRSRGKTQYGVKRGQMHNANLYRVTIKDAPGYNERIFKKHIVSDVLDTCVQIIVDGSGSMSGDKYANAITAAIHLSDTLGNTLHMPIEILGFTEHERSNTMFIYRNFDTKRLSKEKLVERMAHAGQFSAGNCDGDAVLFGYHRIKERREKRKVMIVLSDGSPAGTRPGNLQKFTREIIQKIEKEKKIDIIGIGIMHRNVEKFYKEHQIIKSPSEIEPALLKLIQRKIV